MLRRSTTRSRMCARSPSHAAAVERSVPDTPSGRWQAEQERAKIGAIALSHARRRERPFGAAREAREGPPEQHPHVAARRSGRASRRGRSSRPSSPPRGPRRPRRARRRRRTRRARRTRRGRGSIRLGRVVDERKPPLRVGRVDGARRRRIEAAVRADGGVGDAGERVLGDRPCAASNTSTLRSARAEAAAAGELVERHAVHGREPRGRVTCAPSAIAISRPGARTRRTARRGGHAEHARAAEAVAVVHVLERAQAAQVIPCAPSR